jgi:lysophospholipase L1-like esterase
MSDTQLRTESTAARAVRISIVVLALAAQAAIASAQAATGRKTAVEDRWVPTWGTAQQLIRTAPPAPAAGVGTNPVPTPAPSAANTPAAVASSQPATAGAPPSVTSPPGGAPPATPPAAAPMAGRGRGGQPVFRVTTLANQTVRMILRTSIGGRRARVKLSNAFGSNAVTVGAAHIARRAADSSIVAASDRPLTFAGKASFTMMPGVVVVSDPVDIEVPALSDLAVSLYFPEETGSPTTHATGLRPTYVSTEGDFSGRAELPLAGTTQQYYWLSSVEVTAPAEASAIVAFGDSITDGARSTPDTNNAWPALLAARLNANKATANIGVVNEGIGGNRLLTDAAGLAGVSALARLDRDVLSHPGVKWLMILEGINDIGTLGAATPPATPVTTESLIWALQQVIDRAHAHGIKVVGCTLTPYEGAGYSRENGEVIRDAVNRWIRTSGAFDAVVDFEAATRDPNNPKRFRAEFDPGDHLHPNDAGYKAMADAIDLSIFSRKGNRK